MPHHVARCFVSALLGLGCCLGAGCRTVRVIEQDRPLADTTLVVIQSDGRMLLSWQSRQGLNYSVWYADRRDAKARWQVLPGAERMVGTGATMEVSDPILAGRPRYYRLQTAPQGDRRP